jgi:hypothetical protein
MQDRDPKGVDMPGIEIVVGGVVVAAVLGTIVALAVGSKIARRVVDGIMVSKREELNKLNEQIATAAGQREQARREIATLVAIELRPEQLTNISQEARTLLVASKRALLVQAQADQETIAARLTSSRRGFNHAYTQTEYENVRKTCRYFQGLLDEQAARVAALSEDVQVACMAAGME